VPLVVLFVSFESTTFHWHPSSTEDEASKIIPSGSRPPLDGVPALLCGSSFAPVSGSPNFYALTVPVVFSRCPLLPRTHVLFPFCGDSFFTHLVCRPPVVTSRLGSGYCFPCPYEGCFRHLGSRFPNCSPPLAVPRYA